MRTRLSPGSRPARADAALFSGHCLNRSIGSQSFAPRCHAVEQVVAQAVAPLLDDIIH